MRGIVNVSRPFSLDNSTIITPTSTDTHFSWPGPFPCVKYSIFCFCFFSSREYESSCILQHQSRVTNVLGREDGAIPTRQYVF
jgi:hypothetical protein